MVKPGSVNADLVSNVDFAETLLEAAGVPIPVEMQGRTCGRCCGGAPADWRKSFYYHYYEYPIPHHVRPHYGVVTDRYKLVHFYFDADYWELFDLKADPHELRSVYGQPGYAARKRTRKGAKSLAQGLESARAGSADRLWPARCRGREVIRGPQCGNIPAGCEETL